MTTPRMVSRRAAAAATVAAGAVAVALVPAAADARPVSWGGFGSNDLGPGTLVLKVENGRARIGSLQAIMACVDQGDGTESERAFSIGSRPGAVTLNRNRFSFDFTASSGGRRGHVRLAGTLGSGGRGTARLNLTATGRDDSTGGIIERCQAALSYNLRRGR